MKRRRLLQSMAAVPVLPAAAQRYPQAPSESAEMPKLAETAPDAVSEPRARLFSPVQAAALGRLAELMVPSGGERPGAVDAGAPAFLDFLLSESNAVRQRLYRDGLDKLNSEAARLYAKPFASLSAAEAKPILAPLEAKWSYHPPADSFARFLREVKEDLLQATINSRQYAVAMSRRSRSAAGMGAYWLPLD